ncbi:PP2C family protein-serine/threonine phosphatase [Streptomyces anulatus]|uniref:PP2C family protein-serine/threonine phosphatase n=1 Tax=Streptomyces anulatus TaxID=1892 RepID=UPI0034221D85
MRDIHDGYAGGSGADGTRALARALPPLLVVIGIVWQAVTPQEITGTPFFTAAPLVAAPLFARWVAALFGAVGILAAVLLHVVGGRVTSDAAAQYLTTELATIAFATVLAVLIHGVVERARDQAATARGVAEAAQRAVLPTPPARIDGLRLAARYEAARTDTLVGGDFYAALHTPYGVRLIVGDVRGKGLGAIETVAVILGAFWEAADSEPCLPALADRLEKALIRGAERRRAPDISESFATCILAEIPPGQHSLRILNRGHPEPFFLDAAGEVTKLHPGEFALPLGLGHLSAQTCRSDQWPFPPDSTLLLYTDGLTESRDTAGDFYDPARHLEGREFSSPETLLTSIAEDVRRYTNGARDDDMALLAVSRSESLQPLFKGWPVT